MVRVKGLKEMTVLRSVPQSLRLIHNWYTYAARYNRENTEDIVNKTKMFTGTYSGHAQQVILQKTILLQATGPPLIAILDKMWESAELYCD